MTLSSAFAYTEFVLTEILGLLGVENVFVPAIVWSPVSITAPSNAVLTPPDVTTFVLPEVGVESTPGIRGSLMSTTVLFGNFTFLIAMARKD